MEDDLNNFFKLEWRTQTKMEDDLKKNELEYNLNFFENQRRP